MRSRWRRPQIETDDELARTRPTADSVVVRRQLLAQLDEEAMSGGFRLADTQRVAAEQLAELGSRVAAGAPLPLQRQGVYLWGPVGRGKTWLLDRFFEAIPVAPKSRFHFQRFFRDFNGLLAGRPIGRDSIAASLERLIGQTRLLCFDEFYAHEAGDATLLTRLLEEILTRQIPLVVTSNYPPHGLLPDAELWTSGGPVEVSHRPFQRGIELIEQSLIVLGVDDGTDYRSATPHSHDEHGFRAGRYVVPGTPDQLDPALSGFRRQRPEALGLAGGRRITPSAVHDRQIAFEFSELCGRPVSAGDILGLTGRYTTWTVIDVPQLAETTPEAAQRFVNLVDVLHDADVCLNIITRHPVDLLVAGTRLPPDIARAASRLALLHLERQSQVTAAPS